MAGTVKVEGTAATAGLELERLTISPPESAVPFRFTTFAVVDSPAVTVPRDSTTEAGIATHTPKDVLAIAPVRPLRAAEMVTVVLEATALVLIVNVDETVAPPATVTEGVTEASAGLAVERLKISPPAGAGVPRIRLFEFCATPPCTPPAGRLKETEIGFTVRMAVMLYPFTLAVIVTGVLMTTSEVEMVKLEETVLPSLTVTDAGTDAMAGLELERLTVHPPAGAGLLKVTTFEGSAAPPTALCNGSPIEKV